MGYDMGWQKRSTARRCDSISEDGFIVGFRSGRMIGLNVRGGIYKVSQRKEIKVPSWRSQV